MDILVLGGTSFVGRAIVEDLLAGSHAVTLFSRGRTGADLFPSAQRLTGDRETGDYASLAGGRWDAVVDVSCYVPRHVAQATHALEGGVGRWLFISTGSVYDIAAAPDVIAEDAPRVAPVRDTEDVRESYGGLKVACEDDVVEAYGDRATIVRPGIVAGPHDHTERFTWWARRAARGGRMALPARPEQPVQVLDSADLARLVTALLEADRSGTFNAVGPAEPVTLAGMVEACATAAGSQVELVPVEPVDPPLPLVVPPSWDVHFRRSSEAARAVGLTATPLEQTARQVLAWDRARGEPDLPVGLSPEQEAALLA